ncbi:MAG: hypothetical protein KBE16_01660 [Alphaproteobacteria bacterium]|jgi:hypothetical protein|nr:hypothetical protein [Alphaproteobacteria bacterium]MBP9876841.1 hypothetical protein [Alphaproteobacteria bacterium]
MVRSIKNEKDLLQNQIEKLKELLKKELQKPNLKAAQRDAKSKLTPEEQSIIEEKVTKIVGIIQGSVERKKREIETAEFMSHTKEGKASSSVKTKKSFRTGRV